MDLRTLRYFCALVQEGHFGRAAAKLGIAQPPLSRQIQNLEQELDVALLHRIKKRFEVTPAGLLLYERARRLLDGADQAQTDVRRAGAGDLGRLSLGFVHSTAFTILPGIISRFRRAYPDVELELREMLHNNLVPALESGSVDAGLQRPPINSRLLQVSTLIREPFLVLVPVSHRLAGRKSVNLKQLADEPFVLFSRAGSPLIHSRVVEMCLRAGFTPSTVQYADQIHTVAGFVGAGMGVGIAPATVASFNFTGLKCLQITDRPAALPMALAWRTGNASMLLRNLTRIARTAANAWSPAEPPKP